MELHFHSPPSPRSVRGSALSAPGSPRGSLGQLAVEGQALHHELREILGCLQLAVEDIQGRIADIAGAVTSLSSSVRKEREFYRESFSMLSGQRFPPRDVEAALDTMNATISGEVERAIRGSRVATFGMSKLLLDVCAKASVRMHCLAESIAEESSAVGTHAGSVPASAETPADSLFDTMRCAPNNVGLDAPSFGAAGDGTEGGTPRERPATVPVSPMSSANMSEQLPTTTTSEDTLHLSGAPEHIQRQPDPLASTTATVSGTRWSGATGNQTKESSTEPLTRLAAFTPLPTMSEDPTPLADGASTGLPFLATNPLELLHRRGASSTIYPAPPTTINSSPTLLCCSSLPPPYRSSSSGPECGSAIDGSQLAEAIASRAELFRGMRLQLAASRSSQSMDRASCDTPSPSMVQSCNE